MALWWWMGLPLAGCQDYGLSKDEGGILRVDPGELHFADPLEDVVTETFRVWNVGDGSLDVTGVTIEGAPFVLPSAPEGELASGESWEVDVVYTPSGEEGDLGWAFVTTADGQDGRVRLVGRGVALEDPTTDSHDDDGVIVEVPLADGEQRSLEIEFTVNGGLDIAFLLDTTRSMNSLLDSLKDDFSLIATDVDERFGETAWGVATFDDYAAYPYGSPGTDLPFQLRVPITRDLGAVATGLGASVIHMGQDAPESDMEAMVQALTGRGYDMGCDGVYDALTDVPPFLAHGGDAFGGTAAGVGDHGEGGMGFREGYMPVIIYATNSEMRDADDERYTTPGGCVEDAGMADVAAAASELGAKLIGVAVNMSETSYAFGRMLALGEATGSYADLDGNGTLEPAAVTWAGESATVRTTIVDAVTQLVGAMEWQMVWIEVDDPYGIVVDIEPDVRADVRAGETLTFLVTLEGTPLAEPVDLVFRLRADTGVVLAEQTVRVTTTE